MKWLLCIATIPFSHCPSCPVSLCATTLDLYMFSTGPPLPLPLCAPGLGVCKPWRRPVGRILPSCRSCPLSCLFLFMCHLQLQVTKIQPLTGCVSPRSIGGWALTANAVKSRMLLHYYGTAHRLLPPHHGMRQGASRCWTTAIQSVQLPSTPQVHGLPRRIMPAFGTCSTRLCLLWGICPIPNTQTYG